MDLLTFVHNVTVPQPVTKTESAALRSLFVKNEQGVSYSSPDENKVSLGNGIVHLLRSLKSIRLV